MNEIDNPAMNLCRRRGISVSRRLTQSDGENPHGEYKIRGDDHLSAAIFPENDFSPAFCSSTRRRTWPGRRARAPQIPR